MSQGSQQFRRCIAQVGMLACSRTLNLHLQWKWDWNGVVIPNFESNTYESSHAFKQLGCVQILGLSLTAFCVWDGLSRWQIAR